VIERRQLLGRRLLVIQDGSDQAMLLLLIVVIATIWSRSERMDISPVRAQWRFASGMR
jgi:hypothetical protein